MPSSRVPLAFTRGSPYESVRVHVEMRVDEGRCEQVPVAGDRLDALRRREPLADRLDAPTTHEDVDAAPAVGKHDVAQEQVVHAATLRHDLAGHRLRARAAAASRQRQRSFTRRNGVPS
jgi:hypothetical protein